MLADTLIHATGLFALTLNVSGVVRPNDRTLMRTTGWASALWAVNNVLIGAHTAAALSVLSVGRQSAAAALHGSSPVRRSIARSTATHSAHICGICTFPHHRASSATSSKYRRPTSSP